VRSNLAVWRDHLPGKHHDSNCQLCLQLHQPLLAGGWSAARERCDCRVWVGSHQFRKRRSQSLPLLQIVCRRAAERSQIRVNVLSQPSPFHHGLGTHTLLKDSDDAHAHWPCGQRWCSWLMEVRP
jgi:hypothetical protein